MTDERAVSPSCNHQQCCICLKRQCQAERPYEFKRFGEFIVCGTSCVIAALSVAYYAACRLGGNVEQPCGKETANVKG